MKRLSWYMVGALVFTSIAGALPAAAQQMDEWSPPSQRRPFIGAEAGVMLPLAAMANATPNDPCPGFGDNGGRNSCSGFVDVGGAGSLLPGYMFNDYLGIISEIHFMGGKTKERGPLSSDKTTWAGGFAAGPRFAYPLGKHLGAHSEAYVDGRFGVFSGYSGGQAITDTSFGLSVGGGLQMPIAGVEGLMVGPFARWYRYYQRIQGKGDVQYITVGMGFSYNWWEKPPPPPVPPPPPPPPPPPGPPPVTKKKIVPRAVYFDFDKSNIRPDARVTLDEAISLLKSESFNVVICQGNTDSVGTEAYNMGLSLRRARSVKDYLVRGGIPDGKIKTEGFGETKPVASNATAEGRQQNRRVELVIQ